MAEIQENLLKSQCHYISSLQFCFHARIKGKDPVRSRIKQCCQQHLIFVKDSWEPAKFCSPVRCPLKLKCRRKLACQCLGREFYVPFKNCAFKLQRKHQKQCGVRQKQLLAGKIKVYFLTKLLHFSSQRLSCSLLLITI